MEACKWRYFLAGAAAATAIASLALLALVLRYYAPIYREAQAARPALAAATRLITALNQSSILESLNKLNHILAQLNQSLSIYNSLYIELQRHREIIELVYNETHSPGFNRTIERLVKEAETLHLLEPILGSALSRTLETVGKLLESLRRLSELAHQALELTDTLPPHEVKRLLRDAEVLLGAVQDPALRELILQAPTLLAEANKTLSELPPPQPLAASAALAGAVSAAAALYLLHSCRGEATEAPRGSVEDASPAGGPRGP